MTKKPSVTRPPLTNQSNVIPSTKDWPGQKPGEHPRGNFIKIPRGNTSRKPWTGKAELYVIQGRRKLRKRSGLGSKARRPQGRTLGRDETHQEELGAANSQLVPMPHNRKGRGRNWPKDKPSQIKSIPRNYSKYLKYPFSRRAERLPQERRRKCDTEEVVPTNWGEEVRRVSG